MIGLQISFGKNKIDKQRFMTIRNYDVKPLGGLWSSTLRLGERYFSQWHEFGLSIGDKKYFREAVVFDFKPSARIYTINGQDDLKRLVDTFGLISDQNDVLRQLSISSGWAFLNFEKIARRYDVIHLTSRGQAMTRHMFDGYSLYGWDVESSLTLSLDAIGAWRTVRIEKQV